MQAVITIQPGIEQIIPLADLQDLQRMRVGRISGNVPVTGFTKAAVVAINRTMDPTGKANIVRRLAEEFPLPIATMKDLITVRKANYEKVQAELNVSRRGIPLIQFRPNQVTLSASGVRRMTRVIYKKNADGQSRAVLQEKTTRTRPTGGVSVLVSKSKGREVLKSTFISRMKTGHVGVFERLRGTPGQFDMSALPLKFVPLGQPNARPSGETRIATGLKRGPAHRLASASGRVWRLPIVQRYGKTPVGFLANAPGVMSDEVGKLQGVLVKNLLSQVDRLLKRKKVDHG